MEPYAVFYGGYTDARAPITLYWENGEGIVFKCTQESVATFTTFAGTHTYMYWPTKLATSYSYPSPSHCGTIKQLKAH